MLIIVLVVWFTLIFGYITCIKSVRDNFYAITTSFMFAALFGFIAFNTTLIIGVTRFRFEYTESKNLANIQTFNDTEGRFFLGTGEIKGELYYSFFYESGDDEFRHMKVKSGENVTIHELSTGEPYVEITWDKCEENFSTYYICTDDNDKEYDFYLPVGTIRSEYTLP